MLSENQCKRLLKQSESAWTTTQDKRMEGWLQALRLVLEVNGPAEIRDTELEDDS
tara:strand:- start:437 stop:601 length:165 start_codon:yes stop_codon:yes gene_type:complete